ncbi:hypothetical protein IAE22_29590 [Bacillus sp. S34]|nr:hypothetical protein [Bacillus sp. S34]
MLVVVFQDPASSLNPRQTIGWSIAEPLAVHRRGMSSADRRKRIDEVLDAGVLADRVHQGRQVVDAPCLQAGTPSAGQDRCDEGRDLVAVLTDRSHVCLRTGEKCPLPVRPGAASVA